MNRTRQEADDRHAGTARASANARSILDAGTALGIAATLVLLLGVMIAGAGYAAGVFWQASALLLVVGGSVLATLAAVPAGQLLSVGRVLRNALYVRTRPTEMSIEALVRLAESARREGLLSLERPVSELDDPFLQRAMRMAIDGADGATITGVMQTEMEATDLRHACGKGVLESIARFAPVFGMIGTIIGLIIMLGHMDDPTKIGPGMAVALLTTLYGLVVANVFCVPLARKLTHRSSEELLNKTIILKGVLAIQAGDHPRTVEQKLRAYLPASQQESTYRPSLPAERAEVPAGATTKKAEPVSAKAPARNDTRELSEAA